MKIEEQVTSLEVSKKLKELGVEQESYFYWVELQGYPCFYRGDELEYKGEKTYSAFTVTELGELFKQISIIVSGYNVRMKKNYCRYLSYNIVKAVFLEDTEANARGKMLIYLIEHNLIDTHAKH